MGGKGARFGSPLPKQFHRLAGKRVYQYALEQLLQIADFASILLVCESSWVHTIHDELSTYRDPRLRVIAGGQSRQESSFLGLRACPEGTTHVLLHDAVRPFVSQEILLANIQGAITHGAVDTCIPSTDTLVHTLDQKQIHHIPLRSEYWKGQTPQSFAYPLIMQAHRAALENPPRSDDGALVLAMGHPLHIILGSEKNIKITTEWDLLIAEQLLGKQATSIPSERGGNLQGKLYAITGGSGGIGKAIRSLLEQEGATALCLSKSSPHYPVDLTSFAQTKEVFSNILKEHGPLDGLINAAGLFSKKPLLSLNEEEIQQLIQTNFTSVAYTCCQAQIKPGGHILNIASSSYIRGRKNYCLYSAAKAGVVNLTQGLAEELPHLCINTLIPQRTDTPMRCKHFPEEDPSSLLQPDEVAKSVIHLLKQEGLSGKLVEVRKYF